MSRTRKRSDHHATSTRASDRSESRTAHGQEATMRSTTDRANRASLDNRGSTKRTTLVPRRAPLWVRIIIVSIALICLCASGTAAVNLMSIGTFNQATQQLTKNLKAAEAPDADPQTLHVQQQQVDAQFNDAASMHALLLPQVAQAIDTNTAISAALTARLAKIADQQQGEQQGSSDTASTNQQSDSSNSNSSGNSQRNGGLTQEQRAQVEELLKANQQSTQSNSSNTQQSGSAAENGSSGNSTPKPW